MKFSEEENIVMEEDKKAMAEPKDGEPKEEEEKQMEEPVKEDEKEEEVENKEFSLDAYADVASTLAMLESETEKNQELAKKVMSEMTAQEIVLKFVEMSKEVDRLKAFESQIEEDKCTKKLSTIMASVKEDLDEDSFTEFAKEGKTLKFAELDAFENKVNAFAYKMSKGKGSQNKDAEILLMGMPKEGTKEQLTAEDIFKKYS